MGEAEKAQFTTWLDGKKPWRLKIKEWVISRILETRASSESMVRS